MWSKNPKLSITISIFIIIFIVASTFLLMFDSDVDKFYNAKSYFKDNHPASTMGK